MSTDRICAPNVDYNRAYCGRKDTKTAEWPAVTCEDCKAAWRADGQPKGTKR